jgi:hypothetical protein
MTVAYAAACKWVCLRSSISAITFDIENERKEATIIKKMASAKRLLGQIRLPSPNMVDNAESSRRLPSGLINRSDLNESGSGYLTGSQRTALTMVEN